MRFQKAFLLLFMVAFVLLTACSRPGIWVAFHGRIEAAYDSLEIAIGKLERNEEGGLVLQEATDKLVETLLWDGQTLGDMMDFRTTAKDYGTWRQDTKDLLTRRIKRIDILLEKSHNLKRHPLFSQLPVSCIAHLGNDVDGYLNSLLNVETGPVTVTSRGTRHDPLWRGIASCWQK